MMEIIEKCMRSSDLSGLHALQSMWDCSDSSTFSSDRLLKSKKTLLMTASRLGHLECCKFLLSISVPKIDSRSKLEANLSVYRHYEHLRNCSHHLFLHLSRRNNVGFTALHYAAYHGHEDVVFLLLEASAGITDIDTYQLSCENSVKLIKCPSIHSLLGYFTTLSELKLTSTDPFYALLISRSKASQ